jgi:hypothetical protein
MKEIISCKVPNGQMLEQYILPNREANTRIIINPPAFKTGTDKNFNSEGMNCR